MVAARTKPSKDDGIGSVGISSAAGQAAAFTAVEPARSGSASDWVFNWLTRWRVIFMTQLLDAMVIIVLALLVYPASQRKRRDSAG